MLSDGRKVFGTHRRPVSQYCTRHQSKIGQLQPVSERRGQHTNDWIDKRPLLVGTAAVGAKRTYAKPLTSAKWHEWTLAT